MDSVELRIECLRLATQVAKAYDGEVNTDLIETAKEFYQFATEKAKPQPAAKNHAETKLLIMFCHSNDSPLIISNLCVNDACWSALGADPFIFLEGTEMVMRKTGHAIEVFRRPTTGGTVVAEWPKA
jgi:hypothetical protein